MTFLTADIQFALRASLRCLHSRVIQLLCVARYFSRSCILCERSLIYTSVFNGEWVCVRASNVPFLCPLDHLCYSGSVLLWVIVKRQGMSHQCDTLSLSLHLSPNTLTSWGPPPSLNQLLIHPSSAVCRSQRGRLGWAGSLCDPACVFAQHPPPHSKRFTDTLGGGLEARSCAPLQVWRAVWLCVRVCLLDTHVKHLPPFLTSFPESDLVFPVSTTGMSTLTSSSPHSCLLAPSGRSCQSN